MSVTNPNMQRGLIVASKETTSLKVKKENAFLEKKTAYEKCLADKTQDSNAHARAYYHLAVLFHKKDMKLAAKAIEYLSLSIQMTTSPEIKAYALKERTLLITSGKAIASKLKDLKEACELLDKVREFKEDEENKERARTYLYYGEALLAEGMSMDKEKKVPPPIEIQERYQAAIQVLNIARKLRPYNAHTIKTFLQAHHLLKPHENVLEFLREIDFDPASIEGLEAYLSNAGMLPLWLEAARWGSIALIEYLAPHIKDKGIVDVNGNNALHLLAEAGHRDLLPYLQHFRAYISIEAQNKAGLTPLFVAAKQGRIETVHAFFKMGALYTSKQAAHQKNDLLSVIIENEQTCLFEALVKESKDYPLILRAVGKYYFEESLHKIPSDEKQRKELERQVAVAHLYHKALACKSLTMLRLVTRYHPEGMHTLYKGNSSLHFAVNIGFKEAAHFLVENGFNIELHDREGQTAKVLAEKLNNKDLSIYLANALQQKQMQERRISEQRRDFIEQCKKNLSVLLVNGREKAEWANLNSERELSRFTEQLTLSLTKTTYDKIFDQELNKNLDTLCVLLVNTLFDKIQKKEPIIKKRGIPKKWMFDKLKLIIAINSILESPWQQSNREKNISNMATTAVSNANVQKGESDLKKLQEINYISPQVDIFCERFEKQFDEAFGYFRSVASGESVPIKDIEDQRKADLAKQVSGHLPSVPLPFIGLSLPTASLVSGAIDLMLYFRQRYRKKQAELIVNLFKAVTPYERTHFIRYTAEQLAAKYHRQIHHLASGSEGIELFADCAAARVVEYITSDKKNQLAYEPSALSNAIRVIKSWVLNKEIPPEESKQKALYHIFLDGIVRVTSDFHKDVERLKTINHLTLTDNWTSKGIFENTGIELETGELYAHPNANINSYGYCRGTQEEAKNRGLTLGPNPSKGQFWGKGREFEPQANIKPLESLPPNHMTLEPKPSTAADPLLHAFPTRALASPSGMIGASNPPPPKL